MNYKFQFMDQYQEFQFPSSILLKYLLFPTLLKELIFLSEDNLAYLFNFKVEWHGVGSIAWEDKVDVWKASINKIAIIKHFSLTVYSENLVNSLKLGNYWTSLPFWCFTTSFPSGHQTKQKRKLKEEVHSWSTSNTQLLSYNAMLALFLFMWNIAVVMR